jgi:hypothetical protein
MTNQKSMIETILIQLPMEENKQDQGKFETTLIEAVDMVFSSLFGSHKEKIYAYLRQCYSIDKQEIPHRVETFARAIEETFGQSAQLIEMEIMRTAHSMSGNLKVKPRQKGLTFADYVEAMRAV